MLVATKTDLASVTTNTSVFGPWNAEQDDRQSIVYRRRLLRKATAVLGEVGTVAQEDGVESGSLEIE
jgi:hypothetical protein